MACLEDFTKEELILFLVEEKTIYKIFTATNGDKSFLPLGYEQYRKNIVKIILLEMSNIFTTRKEAEVALTKTGEK